MFLYDKSTGQIREEPTPVIPAEGQVGWLHFTKPTPDVVRELFTTFQANRLLERAVSKNGNPRILMLQDHAYLSFYGFRDDWSAFKISFLIGRTYLVTMSEEELPFLEDVCQRLRDEPTRMNDSGTVLYLLLDALVEWYLVQVDVIAEQIENIERSVFNHPFEQEIGHRLFEWKRRLHRLRSVVEEEHGIVLKLADPGFLYFGEVGEFYYQDLDHSFSRVVTAFDHFKEAMGSIFDIQMSLKSDRANQVMKTLTLVSSVFMPITFVAGVYGMNFEYMPELTWRYGYLWVMIFMASIVIGLVIYFRKKGWY